METLDNRSAVVGGTTMPEKTSRYSVSRAGMGGRKPKYSQEFLQEFVDTKVKDGVSIKQQCRDKGLPYISIYMAMKRVGLDNPRKVQTTSAPAVVVVADGDHKL